MKEVEIEVFRAGTPAARGITPQALEEVATFDCEANPVAICFGHPKSDTPAAGTISKFRAVGNSLFATVKSLTEKAVEGIKADEWLNRSMAFFDPTHEANPRPGKWSPRHVGLLGAAAPGIPNMGSLKKALAFDADGELIVDGDPADAVIYAGAPTPTHIVFDASKESTVEKTPEQIEAERKALDADKEQLAKDRQAFEASQKTAREQANGSLVDGLISKGLVAPANADRLKMVFNALDHGELEFAADAKRSPAVELASFLADNLKPVADVSGKRLSPADQFNAGDGKDSADPQAAAASIDAKAREKMKAQPGLTFEAAVEAVFSEQNA